MVEPLTGRRGRAGPGGHRPPRRRRLRGVRDPGAVDAAGASRVTLCVITDGDAGGFDPDVPRSDIPGIRRAEQRAAAALWGVDDVVFLGYRDGELTVSHDLRRDISRVIRQVRPRRMLIQSPERNWERIQASHPDHLAAGEAAIQAVYPDARNPFAHASLLGDEGLEAWTVEEVWVMAGPQPDHARRHHRHLRRSRSPHCGRTSRRPHTWTTWTTFVRGWGEMTAERFGLPDGRLAEAFQVVRTG